MRIIEKILVLIALFSLVLKFLFIPSGDELFMLSMLALAALYYPLGFLLFNGVRLRDAFKRTSYENLTGAKIAIAVVSGISLSIVCVGTLFKLMSLPGANEMLSVGVVATIIVSIAIIILLLRKKEINGKAILVRTIIIGVLGIIVFFTPQLSIVKLQYRNHPAYVEAYSNYAADLANEKLRKKEELEHYRMVLSEQEFKEYEQAQGNQPN